MWFLWLVPLMVVLFLVISYRRRSALGKFADPEFLAGLMPLASPGRRSLKFFLYLFAVAFIIVALAGPRFGSRLEEFKREGVEIIIALDVSNSMLARDIRPNRLERSKMAISRLASGLRNDRIGLLLFAGDAFVQVPVTSDYAAFRMILDNVTTDIVPVQGTAIGRAIDMAARSFTSESSASRVLIIISDGEDHEDDPVKSALLANEMGITVHTIGMGRPEGTPIPLGDDNSRFLADEEGNTVITRLDEATLRRIASAGNGLYIRAGTASTGLDIIMEEIGKMEREGFEELQYTEFEERFQYMAFIALLLMIIDFMIPERKSRWLNKINLFKADKK